MPISNYLGIRYKVSITITLSLSMSTGFKVSKEKNIF